MNSDAEKSSLSRRGLTAALATSENDIAPKFEPSHSTISPFAWPPKFFERHTIAFEWENTAWALNKQLEHHLESPGDVMCFILRTDEESARYEGRIRPILDICHDVELEDLLFGDLDGPCRKMGWVIDGYYREEKENPWTLRQCRGALSARDMAKLLLEKGLMIILKIVQLLMRNDASWTYVTDIDSWGILALIMTSPESQARLLAGFLQRHLCARPSIGVSIAADGPSIFALDLHVPFHVWRTTDQLLCDPRVKASTGKPLRKSRCMNFLVSSAGHLPTSKVHGIYSGHVGCLVTGYDQWRWTAILSIDTWFNVGEGAADKVERYQFDMEDGMLLDPLGGGQDDAEKPIWEPRAYFLRIMRLRLGQVADEWELVRNNLEDGVDNLGQRKKSLFLRLRPFSTGSDHEDYGREFESFETYLRDLKETLQELLHDLYETLKIGEKFLSTEVNYFRNDEGSPGDATECYPSLSETRRNFNELAQLYTAFVSLKERCGDMTQSCEEARRKYFFQAGYYESNLKGMAEGSHFGRGNTKFRNELMRGQVRADEIWQASSSALYWPQRFLDRPPVPLEWENKPWISRLERQEQSPTEANYLFLDEDADWNADKARIGSLIDIFHDATLEELQDGTSNVPSTQRSLLIDGTYANNVSRFRQNRGGLSARELMKELLKERYLIDDPDNSDSVEAERRLIYMTDMDAWNMLALVSTAPESLFRILGDYMLDYTCSNSSIGVSFSTEGPETFSLRFSLPFYAWRSAEELITDTRIKGSTGQPLRSSRDVTFLNKLGKPQQQQKGVDAIYATHISCLIVGFDQERWTGVMLAETWFDRQQGQGITSPDNIARYASDFEQGRLCDPFDRGKTSMDLGATNIHKPKWHPRLAFMRTLAVRFSQTYKEWDALLQQFDDRANKIAIRHAELISQVRELAQLPDIGLTWSQDSEEFEEFQGSLLQFDELMSDIAPNLRQSMNTAEHFMVTDINYFINPASDMDSAECLPYISQVRKTLSGFRALVFRMEKLQKRCKSMIDDGQQIRERHIPRTAIIGTSIPSTLDASVPFIFQGIITPRSTYLWSLFFKSPIPYFWIIAVLAGNSLLFDPTLWHHMTLGIYAVLPLVLLIYASWLVLDSFASSHSDIRSGADGSRHHRLNQQRLTEDSSATNWIVRKLDLLTGGLSDFWAAYNENQQSDQPSRSTGGIFQRLSTVFSQGSRTDSSIPLVSNENIQEQILICLADEKDRLWRLKHISRADCQDAKSFFITMKSLVTDRPQRRWHRTLSVWGLRRPIGIYYVKFSLRGTGLVRILSREAKFPPRSHPANYRPTETDSYELIGSDLLLGYYKTPPEYDESGGDILDRITHKIDGPFLDDQTRGTGYGLAIEEGPNLRRISNIRLILVSFFVLVGILWSWMTGNIEHGLAIASVMGFTSTVAMATLQLSATSRASIPCL